MPDTVVLAYRHGSSDAGGFNTFSYNANFTNTTGKLSAQFGIHYVNFASKQNDATAHGVGASGVAVFVFPVAGRYPDGVPKAAFAFDVGVIPTVYVSSERNYLTLPLAIGFGVPLSPARAVTFTPWFEIAPSANLDTVFRPAQISVDPGDITVTPNQERRHRELRFFSPHARRSRSRPACQRERRPERIRRDFELGRRFFWRVGGLARRRLGLPMGRHRTGRVARRAPVGARRLRRDRRSLPQLPELANLALARATRASAANVRADAVASPRSARRATA